MLRSSSCGSIVLAAVALVPVVVLGAAPRSGAQPPGAPTLALGGDVIFDAPLAYAIERSYEGRAQPALDALLSDLAPTLGAADLSIVNLECPVAPRTMRREPEHDAPTFAAPPALLEALARAGVDAVTVANNHAYDQGVAGLASTLAHARRLGLGAIGAGEDPESAARAIVFERGGHRIAVAAFSEGSNRRLRGDPDGPRIAIADEDRIARSMREARRGADLVVASLHWTSSTDRLTRRMVRLARAAAEAGADLVYAHGTHRPGPRGVLDTSDGRHVPVLWSLGNLVATMQQDERRLHVAEPSVRDALIVRVRTREDEDGRLTVVALEPEPFWIATPERAWWPPQRTVLVRPLSIRAELARIAEARCGRRCDRFARSYRARQRMIAQLWDRGAMANGGSDRAPPSPARRVGSPRTRPAEVRADLSQAAPLRIEFPRGRAIESAVDRDQLRAIVATLLADRSLRAEIVARPAGGEPASLAAARAHRARGLIAIQGPSRARFTLRVAPAGPTASLTIRIVRPHPTSGR